MQSLHREQPFNLPIRFIQFGEGNFLRAFVDWQIDLLNERTDLQAGVVVVRPLALGNKPLLDVQDGVYTTLVRGLNSAGQAVREFRQIQCVQREVDVVADYAGYLALARNPDVQFIVSNTTEAGIAVNDSDAYQDAPPTTFPAKLTRLLHERFMHFAGAMDKGVVLLPCELIDDNGPALKAAVLHFAAWWQLGPVFQQWLEQACTFCSTLVDRIVTGYPQEEIAELEAELGYRDQFLVTAEHFYLWVIEGPAWLAQALRLPQGGLNIQLVEDIRPYKQQKVGILNGGHTSMVPVALLAGLETVRAAVEDAEVGAFLMRALSQEIIPSLPLPAAQLDAFAAEVLRRFRNPAIQHRLQSIALNSWSKFAARVLPQLLSCHARTGVFPKHLVTALAATFLLYRGDVIPLVDDAAHLAWFEQAWAQVASGEQSVRDLVQQWLAKRNVWGRDLSELSGLTDSVSQAVLDIEQMGIRRYLRHLA
ncbi:tagaturonate reductase [Neisseriaceae bacterium TC5R-5]|nr:tagaturonate reductase [Neisseriaceae bacterium TC5R-5]